MKHKMTRTLLGTLAFAFAALFSSSAWAALSLEETGGTVPTTATLAVKGATLSQLTADTLSGVFGGGWAGTAAGSLVTFNNFDRTSEASGTITCQAQVAHDGNIKGVLLTFTQSGNNINVQKTGAKYVSGTAVGPSVASGVNGEYDVRNLKLTLTRVVPDVCWVGNFPSSQTTVNGVTLNPLNGSSTVTDGIITYGTPGNANGPAFSFSAAGYVAVVFTVDFTGVTLAANQILFTLGNDNNNGLVGAALKSNGSGGFYATGIWVDGAWTTADDSSNTFTLSGEQTFLAIYNKGEDAATKGTHLYVLDNGVAKVLYGGTSGIGLKGGDVTKLGIGGAFGSSGSFTNMAGLKLKKVAIYLSSSSLPMTASDLPGHFYIPDAAKSTVAAGNTVNASAINTTASTYGAAYVYTEAGATLNLDAELNGRKIVFAGSISGVPGSADGLTLGSANDKVTLTNASYVPVIKGRGTVVYPDNTIPSSDSTGWLTSSDWAGTLSLNNIQGANNTQPGWYTPFHNYGSANSTIKVSGFTGFFGAGNFESSATLEIAAGSTFTLNNGNNGNSMTFAKLKGSGDIVICGNNGPAIQYVMRDASEFAGNITVSQSGSSVFKKSIVLGGGSSYNYNVNNYQKQICVLGNVTVAAGKTWTADSGIVVNGTLTKADSTATLPGTITGSGKIVYNDELPDSSNFTANTWTGTVEVNGGSTTLAGIAAANATQFMNEDSTFAVASGTVTLGTAAGLTGTVNVNSSATLQIVDNSTTSLSLSGTNNGVINLAGMTALTTLTLSDGIARGSGTVVYPSSLTTLNVALKENLADDTEVVFNVGNGTTLTSANVTMYKPDGTVNDTAVATLSDDGHSVTVTYTPTVSGNACWIDYEMDYESGVKTGWENSGTEGTALSSDSISGTSTKITGSDAFTDHGMLYTYAHPYRDNLGTFPDNWTAVVRCTVPKYENAVVITFGWHNSMIGLVAGANPETEMKLIRTTSDSQFETLATMTVQDATTAQHVYIFSVENGQTIKVYCDGEQVLDRTFDSFTIGRGFQVGSALGGVQHTGVVRFGKNESPANTLSETEQKNARIDCVRLYKTVLGPNAIRQLSVEFPAVKLFRATVAADATTTWDALSWTPEWDGGNDQSTIILTVEGDATLTLPSTITAEDFRINVADGYVLTLNRPAGGTTITTTNPMEINGGTMYLADDSSLGTWEIGGTGVVRLKNGAVVTGALSGTAKVEIPSGTTVAVISGSIANTITGAGVLNYEYNTTLPGALSLSDWTGAVVLPAITSGEVNLNRYGVPGSTVQVGGISGDAWLANAEVLPTLNLTGPMTLGNFSASFANTIDKLTGSGNFSLAADGSTGGYVDGYFLIKDVSGYTGSISVNKPGLAIGASKPASPTAYGQIVLDAGKSAAIASGKSWTASNGIVIGGTISGSGTLASPVTFANGATLDASATTLTTSSTVEKAEGATFTLIVPNALEPSEEGGKVLNASSSLTAGTVLTSTVKKANETTLDNVVLVTKADGLYVVKPSLDDEVAEVVTDTGIQAAIAKAAAKAGVATVTSIGDAYVPDVAALFYDSIVVADSEVNTTDYAFGISGLTVVSATVDASTDFYVVVTATAEGLTDGATIALKSGSESANAAAVKALKGYPADQTTDGTTTTKIFVLDMPSGTGSFSYEVTVSK